jgi:hypothetical protein
MTFTQKFFLGIVISFLTCVLTYWLICFIKFDLVEIPALWLRLSALWCVGFGLWMGTLK